MTRRYSQANRSDAARALFDIDSMWASCFAEMGLEDLNYCDLLAQMWLQRNEEIAKTQLFAFMPNLSQRTAVKYVQHAIDGGHLLEVPCAEDRRRRLVTLSAECAARLEQFLDYTCERFSTVGRR